MIGCGPPDMLELAAIAGARLSRPDIEPPGLVDTGRLQHVDFGSTADRTTGPIGHGHARSQGQRSRIG
jgi:hypothetical protein